MMLTSVRSFLHRKEAEQDLDEELRSCVDLLAEEKMQRGVDRAEARRQALIELGGMEQVKEEVRAVRGLTALEGVMKELRLGLRNLLRAPGFTVAVILTLGLALGANAAVFTLLDRLILRPLPVKEPAALVLVNAPPIPTNSSLVVMSSTRGGVKGVSYPLYVTLRDRLNVFAGMLAEHHVTATVLAGAEPFAARGVTATDNYFEVLGVRAALGRVFRPGDDRIPGNTVVVLSHGLWQRQFGGDRSILNRTIRLNQVPMTMIGVTAPGFTGTVAGDTSDFFTLISMRDRLMSAPFRYDSPDLHIYKLVARLAPGVNSRQAEHQADALYRQLLTEAVGDGSFWTEKSRVRFASQHLTLSPWGYASNDQSALGRDLKTPLALLMAMVGLVLVVAAGNVGNLFLARSEARSRETAIRFALGSGRWRVLRQSLLESLMLALAAGVVGLLLARWTSRLAPVLMNIESLPDGVTSAPDYRAGLVTLALALAAGLVIWAATAIHAVRCSGSLIQQVRIAGRPHGVRLRRILVAAQVSLSIVLLCSAAVLSRSLIRLMAVDPGFPVENLYSFSLDPGQAGYGKTQSGAFMLRVLDQLGRTPGVSGVSITTQLPLDSGGSGSFVVGDAELADAPREVGADILADVGPGYFANLRMPLVTGREFTSDDGMRAAKVVVLNESLTRLLFGKSNPIGRRVGFQGTPPDMQVVGIVKDSRYGFRAPARPSLFQPYRFQESRNSRASFVLRVGRPGSVTNETVRAVVKGVDPAVAVTEFTSMSEQTSRLLYRDRMLAFVSVCLAGLAALLCGIGIFGLTSFSVARRAQEIGLRIALGASRSSIQWLVMKEVSWLAAVGCGVGVAVFVTSNRVLSVVLFQLPPNDPASLILGAAILGGTAFAAAFLPAWRAAHLDPALTLRQE